MITQSHVHQVPSCMHGHACTVIHDTDFPQNCADLKVCNLSFDTRIFFTKLEILLNNDFKLAYILYSSCIWKNANFDWRNKNLQELFPIPDTHLVFDLSLSHYPLLAQWPYHVLIPWRCQLGVLLYQFYTFWIHYNCFFPIMFLYIDIW